MPDDLFQPEKPTAPPQPLSPLERVIAWTSRGWRPVGTVVAVILALLVMGHVINGNHGLTVWRQKRAEDRRLQKEITGIQRENAHLRQDIDRLKSSPDAIEHEAREKLHYAKPGEVIYTLPTPPQPEAQPDAPAR